MGTTFTFHRAKLSLSILAPSFVGSKDKACVAYIKLWAEISLHTLALPAGVSDDWSFRLQK